MKYLVLYLFHLKQILCLYGIYIYSGISRRFSVSLFQTYTILFLQCFMTVGCLLVSFIWVVKCWIKDRYIKDPYVMNHCGVCNTIHAQVFSLVRYWEETLWRFHHITMTTQTENVVTDRSLFTAVIATFWKLRLKLLHNNLNNTCKCQCRNGNFHGTAQGKSGNFRTLIRYSSGKFHGRCDNCGSLQVQCYGKCCCPQTGRVGGQNGGNQWEAANNLFLYFKIVDNYYYQLILGKVSTRVLTTYQLTFSTCTHVLLLLNRWIVEFIEMQSMQTSMYA